MTGRRLSWVLMALVLAGALVAGYSDDEARTNQDRVFDLASTTKCPTCRSQSVAESEAPIAKEIRADIARRVDQGESDEEIRSFLVSRFGQEVLLTPSSGGLAGLVWVVPVVAFVVAGAALVVVLRRWQTAVPAEATADDRAVVAEALEGRGRDE